MENFKFLLPLLIITIGFMSCGDENPVALMDDFRDSFVGIYDCEKGSTTLEIEVKIDPDNEGNLIIGPYSIPVEEDGSFGNAELEQNVFIELRFDGDEIYYSEFKPIINGLVAPCILRGTKRT